MLITLYIKYNLPCSVSVSCLFFRAFSISAVTDVMSRTFIHLTSSCVWTLYWCCSGRHWTTLPRSQVVFLILYPPRLSRASGRGKRITTSSSTLYWVGGFFASLDFTILSASLQLLAWASSLILSTISWWNTNWAKLLGSLSIWRKWRDCVVGYVYFIKVHTHTHRHSHKTFF